MAYNPKLCRRKATFVNRVKAMYGCECGEKDPRMLDLHHRDPLTKKYEVSRMVWNGSSLETIKDEMRKCEISCKRCHVLEHQPEMPPIRW